MAIFAPSVNHFFCFKNSSIQEQTSRSRNCPRVVIVLSCQNNEPIEKPATKAKEERKVVGRQLFVYEQIVTSVEKFGRELKENMSPRQKGDWKDLTLMSLSFAVYVYMSQKIVCAYFAWMSMPTQSW